MSITAATGFAAGAISAGIKTGGALDLALVSADRSVPAAAVFTSNSAAAAPVRLSRDHIADGRARAVVINSGCANASTGRDGMQDAREMARLTADHLGCLPREVLVCSTGPIGTRLPMEQLADGIKGIVLTRDGDSPASRAILTTDTRPKTATVGGKGFVVGGMAKGAGMLRPDMATMLAVVTTDADVTERTLDESLRRAVGQTFNALNVDGCESTNDTVIVLASGESGVRPDPVEFQGALRQVCEELTRQMASDAEGASKVVTICVTGAPDDVIALRMARAIADSALVRASFYGADPNWGRLLAAMGSTRLHFDLDEVSIDYAGVTVASAGVDAGADADALSLALREDFEVVIDLGAGTGRARLWTTDLTPDYVRFNGERS